MSQKTFDDFLRWKKEQQSRGGYKDDDSSDSDSSVEEVRYERRNVNKKKYYEESDTSSTSDVEEYPSRRRRGEKDRGERRGGDRRGGERRERERDRESDRERRDRERERERYNSDRNGKSRRERSRNGRSNNRRNNRDSSDEEEIVIVNKGDRRKIQLKGNKVIRSKTPRRDDSSDESSSSDSSDDHDRRYRRNVDSSDSEENRLRKKKPITSKSTRSRRSKSEHIQKKPLKKRFDSSEEDQPVQRYSVRSGKTPTISKGKRAQARKSRQIDPESSSEETPRKPTRKETVKKPKSKSSHTEQPQKEKLKIKQKTDSSSSSSDEENSKPKKPTISSKKSNKIHEEDTTTISDVHFDHNLWSENWEKTISNEEEDAKSKRTQLKKLLQQIDHMTDKVCKGSNFIVSEKADQDSNDKSFNLKSLNLSETVKKTKLYAYHHVEKHMPKEGVKGPTKTTAHFIKSDIIDVGLFIKREIKKNPLILMMGDPRTPGGEDHRCLFGEEIAIWRRTAIRECLEEGRRQKYFNKSEKDSFVYDIPQNGAVYCPDVPVFRNKQTKGYAFIAPETLSFVIVPPIMNPKLENGRLREEDVEIVKKKIDMIFLVALANGHDAVVVTAFGCGYAQNPPQHIAEILTESIAKFKNYFSNIAFAIIDNANARKNSPEGNIAPFSNVFSTLLKKHSTSTDNNNPN